MALLHLLGRRRYDVVLIVTNPPANAMAGWAYSRIRGVPYVYLIHDLYPDIAVALGKIGGQSPGTRLFHRWQKLWLDSARVVVVLGRCMRQHLCTCYQVTPERIRVIASWADPKKIRVSPKENSFRQANRLRGFIVLYAGNFSQYVNFDQILGAARRLAGSPNVLFVLVGDGTRKAEILERVEREALNNVRVFPKVTRTEMNEVLGAADASLVPLDPRMLGLGVPSKLYSIMASGRPVIAIVQPESEVALVINEEQCGINVADGDALALADGITRLQGDGELALRMGQNAWSAMMRRFTLEQAAEKYYAIFTEITAA
jgi:glycosyltransferase involved in cell wall biosynthesis